MTDLLRCAILILAVAALNTSGAAEIKLDAQNPAIAALNARRAERAAKLEKWKDSGAVGEDLNGLLKDCQPAGLSLGDKKELRDLLVAENEDRNALFREIRIACNLPATELGAVASAFAEARRKQAAPAR
jgi:uncharacterized protein YdbL (DUF1318 family)